MICQNFTIATRVDMTDELKSYFNSYVTEYNKVYRFMWHTMKSSNFKEQYNSEATFVSFVCTKFNLSKRTVNSIKYDVRGRLKALKALKETELKQLQIRIDTKTEKVLKLTDYINQVKPLVTDNKATNEQLKKYRRCKQSLYYQKNGLNKLRQSYSKLQYQIQNEIYKLGFGGKHTFGNQFRLAENGYKTKVKWYNDYVKSRDKNIFYLGSSDETCGNQMCQIRYNETLDDFSIKIRKEKAYCNGKDDKYIFIDHINFKHLHNELVEIVQSYNGSKNGSTPLSFRLSRKGTKWYIQCIFNIKFEESQYLTVSKYGVLGLDYNEGFIEVSETDKYGNLNGQYHYDLQYHGTGKKAENEMRQIVSKIVKIALHSGKDIIIENLDFMKTKSKTTKAKGFKGKSYNRMIHLFDYARYKETLNNCCHRYKVLLQMVSSVNTSKIGKQKYSDKKKLNIHQAASYVIARRGQGFIDKLAV